MGDAFQTQVKQKFVKMIQAKIDECPLFPELLPDIIFYWKSSQTRKIYKLARHSFKTGKTTYRFFNELLKLQEKEYKMANDITMTVTELQQKRANQLWYAQTIGFNITWKDYRRWHLYRYKNDYIGMRITCKTKDTLTLDELTEFQGGLKQRDDGDFSKIKRSIEKYGFATPFFVWTHGSTNHVLDGHGRLETLKRMQADGEEIPPLPVVYVDCKSEADAKNLLLRINSTYGKMTAETIADFLGDLEIDLDEIKLPDGILDLSTLLENDETKDDDESPEVDEEETPNSKTGEIYELGRNRLICGDCTNTETISGLMGEAMADLILTDPPYNVGYGDPSKMTKERAKKKKIENDNKNANDFVEFLTNAFRVMFNYTKSGAAFYIFYAMLNSDQFFKAMNKCGVKISQLLVWVKDRFTLSYMDYKWKHEPIMYGWKNGSHRFYGAINNSTVFDDRISPEKLTKAELLEYVKALEARTPTDVIYEKKPSRNAEHPTMKPVNLLAQLICNSSKADDIILDPFGGSGSTLIAAEKCGRIARLAELDPHYCDVIRRRWTQWAKANGREVGAGGLE